MNPDLLLGIDVGTTSAKGVVLDRHGTTLAEATSASYPIHHPREGWAEQDPGDWWRAVTAVCRDLGSAVDFGRIAAIAFSGQGCACTLVDEAISPLRPAIIWLDTRAHAQADLMVTRWGSDLVKSNGNAAAAYNVEPKLLWLREHEPETLDRTRAVLTTTAYVTARLTGEFAMNVADAGILHGYDATRATWNTRLLSEMGLDPGIFPPVHPCTSVIGQVTPDAARETGIPAGTPVVAGGEDTPAAALSTGAHAPGDAFLSLGTAAVAGVCLDPATLRPEPAMLTFPHVMPGVTIRSGSMSSAGAAISWWLREFGGTHPDLASLNTAIGGSEPGAGGVIFLPYLSGELHPLLDPAARGVFFGISLSTTADDMARALVEGNAMAIRHNLEVAVGDGDLPQALRTTGGPSRSRSWCQAIADITGTRVEVVAGGGAAVGDALIAGIGVGLIPDIQSVLARTVTVTDTYLPDSSLRSMYDRHYRTFRRLYEHLADDFRFRNDDEGNDALTPREGAAT